MAMGEEIIYTVFHDDGPIRLTETELCNGYMELRAEVDAAKLARIAAEAALAETLLAHKTEVGRLEGRLTSSLAASEEALHQMHEAKGHRDEYARLWHRDAARAKAAEALAERRGAALNEYESVSGEQYDYDTLLYKYVGVRRRQRDAAEALRKIADVEHATNWCRCKQIARDALAVSPSEPGTQQAEEGR